VNALEGFWAFYLGTLIMGWGLLALLVGPPLAGTYLHLLHSVVSLYGLHWMKGATDTDNVYGVDTGALTFWEQIDDGKQWTSKRKAFFAVPIFLYLLATNTAPMEQQPLALNLAALGVLLLAKLPFMHGVRILGINKGRRCE